MMESLNTLTPIMDENGWGLRVEERADGSYRGYIFEQHSAVAQADGATPGDALANLTAALQTAMKPKRRTKKEAAAPESNEQADES
jgi:predicted RNase H-like HicB family nuclease